MSQHAATMSATELLLTCCWWTAPNGNGISSYDPNLNPRCRHWAYSRNIQTRPEKQNISNWKQHESFTSDGGSGWGAGKAVSIAGTAVTFGFDFAGNATVVPAGATLLVIDGPGLGESRTIVGSVGTRQVLIDRPLDSHVTTDSTLGLMVSVGPWSVTGNPHLVLTKSSPDLILTHGVSQEITSCEVAVCRATEWQCKRC